MKEKAKINIQIVTDGSGGYLATIMQAMWFVARVLLLPPEDSIPVGTARTYRKKFYEELEQTGVEKIRIKVEEL